MSFNDRLVSYSLYVLKLLAHGLGSEQCHSTDALQFH